MGDSFIQNSAKSVTSAFVALLLVSTIPAGAVASQPSDVVTLSGNVPPGIEAASAQGPANGADPIGLTISLALRNTGELAQLVADQQDPTSASYHIWLTSDEFDARFGPTTEAIGMVTAWLSSQGFTVSQVNSRQLKAIGTVAQAERAFGVDINTYQLGGRTVFSNAQDPTLPAALAPYVLRVGGLDSVSRILPMTKVTSPVPAGDVVGQVAGVAEYQHSASYGGGQYYLDRDLQVAYNEKASFFDQGARGAPGNEIAIVSSYNVQLSDVNNALTAQGYPTISGASSGARTTSWTCLYWEYTYWWGVYDDDAGCYFQTPTASTGGYDSIESTLDMQMVAGVANDMHIGLYLAGDQSVDTFSQVYQYVADRAATIKVVGHSWGLCVPNMPASAIANDEAAFAKAVTGGQAWFVASGDSGSADCSGSSAASVDYPAASPLVTAVGGTSLANNWGADGWDAGWTNEVACAASGGGVAPTGYNGAFARPTWQVGTGVPSSGSTRLVPDVALHFGQNTCGVASGYSANHRLMVGGSYYEAWGTSPDSQLMAAFWAVENGKLGINAGPAAPLLFRILGAVSGTTPASTFHDITSGCNGAYCAAAGFDMVTGVGSPKFASLLSDLQKLLGSIQALASVGLPTGGVTRLNTLQFSDLSTNVACAPASWDWNFGDGSAHSALQNPTHAYPNLGAFLVTLTVTGQCGKTSSVTLPAISVGNVLPTACLSSVPASILAGTVLNVVSCSTDVDGTIATLQWTIDGVTANGAPSTFTSLGTHTIALRVIDNDGGASATVTKSVSVSPAALATITISGVSSLIAGTVGNFNLAGFDQYGNAVALAQSTLSWTAPTTAGVAVVSYTERGVTGTRAISVLPGALATLSISPASFSLNAGATQLLHAVAVDAYGNAVTVTPSWSSDCGSVSTAGVFAAPTSLATCTVTVTAGGMTAHATGSIVPAALATITVTGPSTMAAGSTGRFDLAGADLFGNPVTLAQSSLYWTAPTTAGASTVSYTEKGITGSKAVLVTPGPLVTISISGLSTLIASLTSTYSLQGLDAYGNVVPLAQSSLDFTAPTTVGPVTLSYSEQGVTGTKIVNIVAGDLVSIVVSGPDTLTAGSTAIYAVTGADAFGNAVTLARSTVTFTAPGSVGPAAVTYTERGITGSKIVTVVSGPLATISITGVSSLVAALTGSFNLAGFDAYGNPVALGQSTLSYTAPTIAGPAVVTYAEQGVTGSRTITVLPGPLASIRVTGPASLAVGSTASFSLAGFDQYNNAVALARTTLSWTAPTSAGSAVVSYTEQGVTGTKTVNVVSGTLHHITVSGPSTLVAALSATFNLAGFDQYGNAVTLAQSAMTFTAPTLAGPALACYGEQGVQGCASVQILPAALSRITLTGPAQLAAGAIASYQLAGVDAYGNAVALAQQALSYTATTTLGARTVSYTEQGITGSKTVQVVAGPLATISITGASSLVAGATSTFNLAGADPYGNPVALAQSTLSWTAPTMAGNALVTYAEQGITGSKSVSVLPAPLATIGIDAPASTIVGSTLSLTLTGADRFGNVVTLAQSTLAWTAPITSGNALATYTERGVTGTASILVLPGPLATIAVTGPTSLLVGATASYQLTGSDAYGNAVQLAQNTLSYTAPTTVGHRTVSYAEQGITGSLGVDIVHGPLTVISVLSPTTMQAATATTMSLVGFDVYGNAVPLARSTLDFTAPTMAGTARACYTESGVQGCSALTVVPGALDHLAIDPSATDLQVTAQKDFASGGFDRFNNPIEVAPTYTAQRGTFDGITYTAPTSSGTTLVTAVTSGVTGSATVQVTPGALARLVISGPTTVKAGGIASYAVAGFDQYGNPVTLATPSWTTSAGAMNGGALSAPTKAGAATLGVAVGVVTATLDVTIVPEAVDHVIVTAPTGAMNVGRGATFAATAFDRYENAVPTTIVWSSNAGTITQTGLLTANSPGTVRVTAAAGGVSGTASVVVLGQLLATVGMGQASYLPTDAVLAGVHGTVAATYLDGTPAAGANVAVTITQTSPVGSLRSATMSGVTDALGLYAFDVPTLFTIVGDYKVTMTVTKLGNSGSGAATFHVGA